MANIIPFTAEEIKAEAPSAGINAVPNVAVPPSPFKTLFTNGGTGKRPTMGRTDIKLTDTDLIFKVQQYVWSALGGVVPVDEFAYGIRPTGAANMEWIGHDLSCKFKVLPKIYVDGTETTVANHATVTGAEIKMNYELNTYHSEVGAKATSIGVIQMELNMKKVEGFTIKHTYTLAVGGEVSGYSGMLSTSDSFDRATYAEGTTNYILSNSDDSQWGKHKGKTFYTWDFDGNIGTLMYVPNLANVDNWAYSSRFFWWLDSIAGTWNKGYVERFSGHLFSNGDVWVSETNYRTQWFPNGANSALAK